MTHTPPSDPTPTGTISQVGARVRIVYGRLARRLGMGDDSFLIPLAVAVGIVTAVAAVGFHELILLIRDGIYRGFGEEYLYGPGLWLLALIPAVGGLVVGVVTRLVSGEKEGHGVVDVMESVARTRGFVKFRSAIEKIFTSAVTIGTGGSAGAEGPIVQIGAAISSGVGNSFRLARHQMPVLVGCGCAAGISAIFNAPIGGLLFTLEVILLDFSVRAITPIIVAAVIANVTMRAMVAWLYEHGHSDAAYITVFADPSLEFAGTSTLLDWPQVPAYVLLGLACGIVGAMLTRSMQAGERAFHLLVRGPAWVKALRPAAGGLLLGLLGVVAVLAANESIGGAGGPFGFEEYPMPAFFGDGYGIIETLLDPEANFYGNFDAVPLIGLLVGLAAVKVLATVFTLSSGGSGGVIAPSLFLGAVIGGAVGVVVREVGWVGEVRPEAYTLVGMAALLAAVVHAPLASLLILFEITSDSGQSGAVLLPALLSVVVALGVSRLIAKDSIYTAALRIRGVRQAGADPALLARMTVEQVPLDPAAAVAAGDPFDRVVEMMDRWKVRDFVVLGEGGSYAGFLTAEDVNAALLSQEALPLVVVGELMRNDVPLITNQDDLQKVFDLFARLDLEHLPVAIAGGKQVIGMISRAGLMRTYRATTDQ
jgi:CIC family chloride channel protein